MHCCFDHHVVQKIWLLADICDFLAVCVGVMCVTTQRELKGTTAAN
jgi:hypothetical protein